MVISKTTEWSTLTQLYPSLSDEQIRKLEHFVALLLEWNAQVNLISRKDTEQVLWHHIAHSLSPLLFFTFPASFRILDLGTGGGLPGIPLAIALPNVRFCLVDSIAKKIRAVETMCASLNLRNVEVQRSRVEELRTTYPLVVTRGVAPLTQLWSWVSPILTGPTRENTTTPHGLLAYKGYPFTESLPEAQAIVHIYPLKDRVPNDAFLGAKALVNVFSSI